MGDFIALPSAVFRIAKTQLRADLEKEGKRKMSMLDTPARLAALWGSMNSHSQQNPY